MTPSQRYPLSRRAPGGMASDRFPRAGNRGPQGPAGPQGPPGPIGVVQDEGTPLAVESALNFTGHGVTATDDAANGRTTITIPGFTTVRPTANFTAASWNYVVCAAAAITVTLPASPNDGDQVAITSIQGGGTLNPHTIVGNGHNIAYESRNVASISLYAGGSIHLVYDVVSSYWRVLGESSPVGADQARAYRAAAINIGTGWTLIPMDTIYYDDNGRFQNGWYYPTVTPCRLFVGANATLPSNGVLAVGIAEYVGGTWIIPTRVGTQVYQSNIGASVVTFAGMFRISAGDGPIGLCAYTSNAAPQALQNLNDFRFNYLECYRIQ